MGTEYNWQGMLTFALIGAASAFVARRLFEWYKAYKSKSSCGPDCGCGDSSKHS